METTREIAVETGAEMLDALHPGWARQIDLGSLDMQTFDRCILGQLYGSFQDGVRLLRMDPVYAPQFGFSLRVTDSFMPIWAELRDLWTAAIIHRTKETQHDR